MKRTPGLLQPPTAGNQDSATPPRSSLMPTSDPSKATCFNCGEVGHFASSCLNPRTTPKIHEIDQDPNTSGDEVHDEADSESEN
jgi:Zinc knuckle